MAKKESNKLEDYKSWTELIDSNFLAGSDFEGRRVTLVIHKIEPRAKVVAEGGRKELKTVATLRTLGGRVIEKRLILSNTNKKRLAKLYGTDPRGSLGKPITLYNEEQIRAFGALHNPVRIVPERPDVNVEKPSGAARQAAPAVPPPDEMPSWEEPPADNEPPF